jgi:DNA-binding LacI/PurR family transcriptional regulator
MTAAGRRPLEPLSGDWSSASGYAAGRAVLESGATAVFCANDQMAMGLLSALHDAGRRVPTDLSVVGFDDIPETPYLIPPLTSVRQDFIGVGQRAVAMLRAAIEGLPPVSTELLQPQLVIRASTAPPRT